MESLAFREKARPNIPKGGFPRAMNISGRSIKNESTILEPLRNLNPMSHSPYVELLRAQRSYEEMEGIGDLPFEKNEPIRKIYRKALDKARSLNIFEKLLTCALSSDEQIQRRNAWKVILTLNISFDCRVQEQFKQSLRTVLPVRFPEEGLKDLKMEDRSIEKGFEAKTPDVLAELSAEMINDPKLSTRSNAVLFLKFLFDNKCLSCEGYQNTAGVLCRFMERINTLEIIDYGEGKVAIPIIKPSIIPQIFYFLEKIYTHPETESSSREHLEWTVKKAQIRNRNQKRDDLVKRTGEFLNNVAQFKEKQQMNPAA